ncbi:MAG: hypothetical protein IK955_00945 [Clostridia bacterium]|nr:hypothetical protein [Clostridia bacterium]
MKTYDEMAENVFRRRDEYLLKKKETRKKTVKLSVFFACMALVLFAGLGVWQSEVFDNKPLNNTEISGQPTDKSQAKEEQTLADSVIVGEKDWYGPVEDTPYINGHNIPLDEEGWNGNGERLKLIESFECDVSSAIACYALPRNGDCFFSIPLNAAFEAYGETDEELGMKLVYRVVVRVFEDGKMITGKENLLKIAEKLGEMGYYAPVEIPNNRDDLAVLSLHVTEDELKNFPGDEERGYFFFLYAEPDGAALPAE